MDAKLQIIRQAPGTPVDRWHRPTWPMSHPPLHQTLRTCLQYSLRELAIWPSNRGRPGDGRCAVRVGHLLPTLFFCDSRLPANSEIGEGPVMRLLLETVRPLAWNFEYCRAEYRSCFARLACGTISILTFLSAGSRQDDLPLVKVLHLGTDLVPCNLDGVG
jgi:hypothetical protein